MVQHFLFINFSKGLCCKNLGRSIDPNSYQGMHMSDVMELIEDGGDWRGDRLAIIGEYADDDIANKLVIPGLVHSFKSGKRRQLQQQQTNQTNQTSTTPNTASNKPSISSSLQISEQSLEEEAKQFEAELKKLLKEDGSPFEFLTKRMKGIKIHSPAIYFDEGKYIVNHTKKQYISKAKFRAPLSAALNAMISCIQDKVGKWSGDSISVVTDIEPYRLYGDVTDLAERTYIQLSKENHNNAEDHDF
ncbi:hypothetical protein FDP41_003278 [Naegleria fowleri]|uniref:Uncharacterized protein n=1 Tax=Naegleria fowleri TaxID=5763 RepID=A0A6A5BS18_NAEFO|nr:uncharacterized protein FDP41_003278 [Naegleria fowleri]KAF0977956.1 hypothetical protein FDP41_003278 [Naegleria fowleri]CAG4714831.1 unnamed protein product [Naegleria fowleri]